MMYNKNITIFYGQHFLKTIPSNWCRIYHFGKYSKYTAIRFYDIFVGKNAYSCTTHVSSCKIVSSVCQ